MMKLSRMVVSCAVAIFHFFFSLHLFLHKIVFPLLALSQTDTISLLRRAVEITETRSHRSSCREIRLE